MEYDSSLAESAYKLAERWDSSRSVEISKLAFQANDLDAFSSTQKGMPPKLWTDCIRKADKVTGVVFLERLQSYKPLPSSHIEHLASLYKVSSTHNAEIRLRFYQFSLVDPSSPAAQKYAAEAADWVIGGGSGMVVGRMKFCRDVFRAVFKVNKDLAVNAFQKEKNSFHPIARKLIEKVNRVLASLSRFELAVTMSLHRTSNFQADIRWLFIGKHALENVVIVYIRQIMSLVYYRGHIGIMRRRATVYR